MDPDLTTLKHKCNTLKTKTKKDGSNLVDICCTSSLSFSTHFLSASWLYTINSRWEINKYKCKLKIAWEKIITYNNYSITILHRYKNHVSMFFLSSKTGSWFILVRISCWSVLPFIFRTLLRSTWINKRVVWMSGSYNPEKYSKNLVGGRWQFDLNTNRDVWQTICHF